MKTIEMIMTDGLVTKTYAMNTDGSGLFRRKSDGTFEQLTGTGQFHAHSPAILARKIRARIYSGAKMVRGSARGWSPSI